MLRSAGAAAGHAVQSARIVYGAVGGIFIRAAHRELVAVQLAKQHGAPLRLIVPFRYGARSLKAIREIQFTATTFTPPKPWPT